ncbi:hypothetical protein EDC16_10389 [Testudinibacter aquarius]|uniref:Uncharacterized protein n=1 Tax=Testudinibacter aquarius TaxID=1524974 RepID=A0A4R3Y8R1_9PAST|nr:hypothetical protein EDC16_10389 [Testudinibacter aquarius]
MISLQNQFPLMDIDGIQARSLAFIYSATTLLKYRLMYRFN